MLDATAEKHQLPPVCHLLSDGCREDEQVPAVAPAGVVREMAALEDEMKDEEKSRQSQQQHGAGKPGLRPEAVHEAKHPANIPAGVLYEETVPEGKISSLVSETRKGRVPTRHGQ